MNQPFTQLRVGAVCAMIAAAGLAGCATTTDPVAIAQVADRKAGSTVPGKIGRASCRERV